MNDTTRCHPRTLREAFGMSPQDAIAIHTYKMPLLKRLFLALIKWGWVVLLLAVFLLPGCGQDEQDTAALTDAQRQARKEAAAQYACGPQAHYEWVNATTIECFTKRGKPAGTTEVAAK